MSYQPDYNRPKRRFSLPLLLTVIGLVGVFLGAGILFYIKMVMPSHNKGITIAPHPTPDARQSLMATQTAQAMAGQQATATQQARSKAAVSPFIFGTNLALFDANDVVLQSAPTRALLQQIHTRIIRMPVQPGQPEATTIQAAQIIKNLGVTPLIVLRGAPDPNVLADDTRVIQDMSQIFGSARVYYEYGNEEDLQGVPVSTYTASWNAVVPHLKRLAPQAHFIGPVNYHYDRAYLSAFLSSAQPRPDEISWHEYTCNDNQTTDVCIAHIANWTSDITDARATMRSVLGTALPIMITEWNYTSKVDPNDGKHRDSAFLSTWTTQALQTLAANRVFASMQYACTDTIPMIKNASLTAQGITFQQQYEQMIIAGQFPSPVASAT